MEKVFEVPENAIGSTLKWEFFTDKKDIGFGVYYADTEFSINRVIGVFASGCNFV
jgi:hypothetical protein